MYYQGGFDANLTVEKWYAIERRKGDHVMVYDDNDCECWVPESFWSEY